MHWTRRLSLVSLSCCVVSMCLTAQARESTPKRMRAALLRTAKRVAQVEGKLNGVLAKHFKRKATRKRLPKKYAALLSLRSRATKLRKISKTPPTDAQKLRAAFSEAKNQAKNLGLAAKRAQIQAERDAAKDQLVTSAVIAAASAAQSCAGSVQTDLASIHAVSTRLRKTKASKKKK